MGGNDDSDASPNQARQSRGHDGLRGGMEMGFGLFYHEGITNANNAPKEEDYRSGVRRPSRTHGLKGYPVLSPSGRYAKSV